MKGFYVYRFVTRCTQGKYKESREGDWGKLHYGELPVELTELKLSLTGFEEISEYLEKEQIPFVHKFTNRRGKSQIKFSYSWEDPWTQLKIKPEDTTINLEVYIEYKDMTSGMTKKDIDGLSLSDYIVWCHDNGLTCQYKN